MGENDDRSGLSRRDFLKALGLGAGAMFAAGCSPRVASPEATPSPWPTPTLTPFQPSLPTGTPRPTDIPSATPTQWTWSLPTQTGAAPAATGESGSKYDGRRLCFVLWDHQLARYNYKPRNPKVPLPETCPLLSGVANRMTPEWEAYWKGILRAANPGMSNRDFNSGWKGLVADARAFTNNKAPDSGNFALWSITAGGATHQVVSGEPEGPGRRFTRIYTLNHKKGPPPIPESMNEIDITRHFMATTGSTIQLADGSYAVYGFPQFENCIVPVISPGDTDLIETERIIMVELGAKAVQHIARAVCPSTPGRFASSILGGQGFTNPTISHATHLRDGHAAAGSQAGQMLAALFAARRDAGHQPQSLACRREQQTLQSQAASYQQP